MVEKEKIIEKEVGGEVTESAAVTAKRETEELPKTIVRRLVKDKLSQLSTNSDVSVFREALLAFSESGRLFIHYLTATANDVCKESNRQILNAEDVLKALEEMDYPEFIQPLRDSLEEYRQKNAGKRSGSLKVKEADRKGKRKEPPAAEEHDQQDGENGDESKEEAEG